MTARLVAAAAALLLAPLAGAEPMFLARQYTRCTTCHYSPAGGGLLTPYGRSLTPELSATGERRGEPGEERFLWGLLGDRLKPVDLGIDLRPSHRRASTDGLTTAESSLATADLLAAVRTGRFTFYGKVGRIPAAAPEGARVASHEYWAGYDNGRVGLRLGRFLPAYGVHVADHTTLTRSALGLDADDQVMALELSHRTRKHWLQVSVGPGFADSVFRDDGRRSFTATARLQLDLTPRTVLAFSGLHRSASHLASRNDLLGVALGLAPVRRLSIWTEADLEHAPEGTGYTLFHETGFEVHRGVWLKLSPQLRLEPGRSEAGTFRLSAELDVLPRTHWNPSVTFYRDLDRETRETTRTILLQLHLYL
jgi:hypothetical protein